MWLVIIVVVLAVIGWFALDVGEKLQLGPRVNSPPPWDDPVPPTPPPIEPETIDDDLDNLPDSCVFAPGGYSGCTSCCYDKSNDCTNQCWDTCEAQGGGEEYCGDICDYCGGPREDCLGDCDNKYLV